MGVRWWAGPGVGPERLERLVARATAALAAGAADAKRGRRKRLHALALEGEVVDHLLKVNDYTHGVSSWRRLRASKARRELARARQVAEAGIPTPVPVAAGEARCAGRLERCWLLVPRVPGAIDLAQALAERRGDARARRACASAFGALARRMHDAGVFQEDFAPNNFLWQQTGAADAEPALLAIDFERTRLRVHLGEAERLLMLAKLDRHLSGASAAARMRFLRAYAGPAREEAHRWWRALEAFAPRLVQRDLAHWRRTSTRPGRRFAVVAARGWRGWARRGSALEEVLAAVEGGASSALWLHPLGSTGPLRGSDAARAWAAAQGLWLRAAAPRPIALLRRDSLAWLVSARAPGACRLADAPDRGAARAAVTVLLDRLLALGAACEALPASAFVLEPAPDGRLCGRLLEPRVWGPPAEPPADRRRRARARAARLVDDAERR